MKESIIEYEADKWQYSPYALQYYRVHKNAVRDKEPEKVVITYEDKIKILNYLWDIFDIEFNQFIQDINDKENTEIIEKVFKEKLFSWLVKEIKSNLHEYFNNVQYSHTEEERVINGIKRLVTHVDRKRTKEYIPKDQNIKYLVWEYFWVFKFTGALIKKDKKEIKRLEREKSLLHDVIEKENLPDKRIPKRKCEDYIAEFLKEGNHKGDSTKVGLAREIQKWINNKYNINFSTTTIRPKLSYFL